MVGAEIEQEQGEFTNTRYQARVVFENIILCCILKFKWE